MANALLEKIPLGIWIDARPALTRAAFFLIGIITMLSFAPFNLYLLAPVLVLPVLLASRVLPPGQAARLGFWFGAGLFLAGTYWLYVSIHVFGQAPLILALVLMLGLVYIMALYYGLTCWLIARTAGTGPWTFLILAPSVWVLVEWLRGWVLSGFPWMTLGYSQIDSPLAGFAPILGIYGVSLAVLFSASALLLTLITIGRTRVVSASLVLALWIAGGILAKIEWTAEIGVPVPTTIVQGGVSQDRKWSPEQFQPTLDLYRRSLQDNPDSTLIVWPEVAIPAPIDQVETYIGQLNADLAVNGQTLLFGILERDLVNSKVFNSLVSIGAEGRQTYRKRHLVPFGEYFPVPDFVREWMRLMNLPYSDISQGEDVQPLISMPDGNRLSVAICYEDAYASEQLYALPEAGILVNVSNDAWFGDSIAPHQHLQIARMRALEVGRSVVRATNNGISAFIGPRGELLQDGPQFQYSALSHDVQPRSGLTVFARLGNWPVIIFVAAMVAVCGWRTHRGSSDPINQ